MVKAVKVRHVEEARDSFVQPGELYMYNACVCLFS